MDDDLERPRQRAATPGCHERARRTPGQKLEESLSRAALPVDSIGSPRLRFYAADAPGRVRRGA